MREIFGPKVVPIQYPLASGPSFNSMIDVLLMKKYSWGPDGGVPTIEEIPAEELDKANELHQALVEAAAENDETLMEKFFEQGHLTEDEMREGIRKGLVDRSIYPVFCVSALKDMGVRRMMEFLGNVVPFVNDMPSPIDNAGDEVKPDSNGPLSIFMFKPLLSPISVKCNTSRLCLARSMQEPISTMLPEEVKNVSPSFIASVAR